MPVPSRAPVESPTPPQPAPRAGWFLFGLGGVGALVLLGGGHHVPALAAALILPGAALWARPPETGPGRLADIGCAALLAWMALAFLPPFLDPAPGWREAATAQFGIGLPPTLSVRPRISFEAFALAVAGFAWFYAALGWPVNRTGRKRIFLAIAVMTGVFAAAVIAGNLLGWRYPGAEDATAFSFFPNRNQTANFLALGGVASFAFAMEGLRSRSLAHLAGLAATGLCLFALVLGVSRAGVLLYFLGILLWFALRVRHSAASVSMKLGLPLLLLVFSLFMASQQRTVERAAEFVATPETWGGEFRALLYRDAAGMIGDAPLAGAGIGNFAAVFPQYRDLARNHQRVVHPESDVFWLAAEAGLPAVAFLGVFLGGCAWHWRKAGKERSAGAYHAMAAACVAVFLLHALVDVPGHRPGTVYFAALFGALLFRRGGGRAPLPPRAWRVLGVGLVVLGTAWGLGHFAGWPVHSSTANGALDGRAETAIGERDYRRARSVLDDRIAARPLDWRGYFRRAQVALAAEGDMASAAADFRRARFVEPTLGVVTYREGFAWMPHDPARTAAAWRETLFREMENEATLFAVMLREARGNPELIERLGELSRLRPRYRVTFLLEQRGDSLMRALRTELERNPDLSHFPREERSRIVRQWVRHGDLASAETFLENHGSGLARPWWLWSQLRRNQARFEEAVELIRDALPEADIPETDAGGRTVPQLQRGFGFSPGDVVLGTALLAKLLERGDEARALEVAEALAESSDPPAYALYWKAELHYRTRDYIESWRAFEDYIERAR